MESLVIYSQAHENEQFFDFRVVLNQNSLQKGGWWWDEWLRNSWVNPFSSLIDLGWGDSVVYWEWKLSFTLFFIKKNIWYLYIIPSNTHNQPPVQYTFHRNSEPILKLLDFPFNYPASLIPNGSLRRRLISNFSQDRIIGALSLFQFPARYFPFSISLNRC